MKTDFGQEILTKPPVSSALQPAPGARAAGSRAPARRAKPKSTVTQQQTLVLQLRTKVLLPSTGGP